MQTQLKKELPSLSGRCLSAIGEAEGRERHAAGCDGWMHLSGKRLDRTFLALPSCLSSISVLLFACMRSLFENQTRGRRIHMCRAVSE